MWKKDDNGNLVADANGNPILTTADGKEEGFSLDANKQHIKSLNEESASRRLELTGLKEQYKAFDGLDATQAREAIEKLSKIDAKTLIDAGQVDVVKAEMSKAYEAQLSEEKAKSTQYESQLKQYIVGQSFGDSKFISENLVIPTDMARSFFGAHFVVNDQNKVVALSDPNNKDSVIYSAANPGEPASFDEALAGFVNAYPNRDSIMKGSGNQGGGASNSHKVGVNAPKSLADCKTEAEKIAYLQNKK